MRTLRLDVLGAAAILSWLVMLLAGYVTQLELVTRTGYVQSAAEVKLAFMAYEVDVARGDRQKLRADDEKLERLAAQEPAQRDNVARILALTASGDQAALDAQLRGAIEDEDRAMDQRSREIDGVRLRSAAILIAGALLSVVFGAGAYRILEAHREPLARAHREPGEGHALLEAVIESVRQGIIAVDSTRKIIAMNGAARAILGSTFPQDRMPSDWTGLLTVSREDGTPMTGEEAPLMRALRGEPPESTVCRVVPAGESHGPWVSVSARPILDEQGRGVAAVAALNDVTEQRAAAEQLRDLAAKDELTGLFNRRGFLANARARMEAARGIKAHMGLVYADVNGLKQVNDVLGHEQGDRIIVDAATVLRRVFRDGDVLARIGGDEFVALLPNLAPSSGESLLHRLMAAVRSFAGAEPRPYRLSISAAVTFVDWSAEETLEDLLARADRGMYERKRARAATSQPVIRAVEGRLPDDNK